MAYLILLAIPRTQVTQLYHKLLQKFVYIGIFLPLVKSYEKTKSNLENNFLIFTVKMRFDGMYASKDRNDFGGFY